MIPYDLHLGDFNLNFISFLKKQFPESLRPVAGALLLLCFDELP
jgi:hypothetical protein